jgi:hypothetical protein
VRVRETRERIVHSPAYDPALVVASPREHWEPFYGYYGLSPYWGTGYMYPFFPASLAEATMHDHSVYAKGRQDEGEPQVL